VAPEITKHEDDESVDFEGDGEVDTFIGTPRGNNTTGVYHLKREAKPMHVPIHTPPASPRRASGAEGAHHAQQEDGGASQGERAEVGTLPEGSLSAESIAMNRRIDTPLSELINESKAQRGVPCVAQAKGKANATAGYPRLDLTEKQMATVKVKAPPPSVTA